MWDFGLLDRDLCGEARAEHLTRSASHRGRRLRVAKADLTWSRCRALRLLRLRIGPPNALEEERDRHAQHLAQLIEPAGAYAVFGLESSRYRAARQMLLDYWADQIVEIADDGELDPRDRQIRTRTRTHKDAAIA